MNPTRRIRPSRSLAGVHPHQQRVLAPIADVQPLRCGEIIEVNRVNLHRLIYVTATRIQQSGKIENIALFSVSLGRPLTHSGPNPIHPVVT